jgi:EF hand
LYYCGVTADANGDGFVSFDEFEALMNSKAVAKPNALNRWGPD